MTPAERAELRRLRDAYVNAEKRLNDALDAIERIRDELAEGRQSLMILLDSPAPRAESEVPVLWWRTPNGPVA